jgi:hypothetical protein
MNIPPPHSEIDPDTGPAGYQEERVAEGRACLEASLAYLALRWSSLGLCPPDHVGVGKTHGKNCTNPGKVPWGDWKRYQTQLPTEAELRQKWHDNCQLNVGITLGGVTGMIGLDLDGAAGEQLLARLSNGDLPATLEFTSGKGRRLLYRVPEGVTLKPTPKPGGLEVEGGELRLLGLGSQTVMPPSRHQSGRLYRWLPGHGPGEIDPPEAPAWVVELMREDGPKRPRAARPPADGRIPEGLRDSTLTSLAGSMRRRGMSAEAIAAALLVENAERCDPPLPDDQVRKIAESVARYAPAEAAGASAGTGKDIILAYLRRKYQPAFRRGQAIFSQSLEEEVRRADVCFGPDSELLEQLELAEDAPWRGKGEVNVGALPKFFATWVRTAWADLLAEQPEEEEAGELSDPAAEEFRRAVAEGLYRQVTFGVKVKLKATKLVQGKETEVEEEHPRQEHRSVIDWCRHFARPGNWSGVRSLLAWTRLDGAGLLRVAVRVELFTELRVAPLARMKQRKFAALAQRYGVGSDAECRPGGSRALELTPGFIQGLLDRPGMTQGPSPTHAREDYDSSSCPEDNPCSQ